MGERQAGEPAVPGGIDAETALVARAEAATAVWVRTTPFGSPVVPLVATTRASPSLDRSRPRRRGSSGPSVDQHRRAQSGSTTRASGGLERRVSRGRTASPSSQHAPERLGEGGAARHGEGDEAAHGKRVRGRPALPRINLQPMAGHDWTSKGDYQDISYETAGGIAKLTICRPEVRNAFRPQTLFELSRAFDAARDDPEVGVVILTGEGPDAFCSGGDQRIRGDDGYIGDDAVAERGIGRLNVLDLQIQIRRLPKPVIAMVAGYAIGGGHVLHLVCDLTIAADNARFGQTGPKVGSFDGGYGAGLLGADDRAQAGEGDLVPLPPVRRRPGARVGPRQRGRAPRPPRGRDPAVVPPRCSPSRRSRFAC